MENKLEGMEEREITVRHGEGRNGRKLSHGGIYFTLFDENDDELGRFWFAQEQISWYDKNYDTENEGSSWGTLIRWMKGEDV